MTVDYEARLEKGVTQAEALIAKNLQYRRDALGMKLWEVSAALGGMDLGNLSRWLSGKREYTVPILVKFGVVFDVDPADWMLPHKAFAKRYPATDQRPFEVRVVPSRPTRGSNRATREYVGTAA